MAHVFFLSQYLVKISPLHLQWLPGLEEPPTLFALRAADNLDLPTVHKIVIVLGTEFLRQSGR